MVRICANLSCVSVRRPAGMPLLFGVPFLHRQYPFPSTKLFVNSFRHPRQYPRERLTDPLGDNIRRRRTQCSRRPTRVEGYTECDLGGRHTEFRNTPALAFLRQAVEGEDARGQPLLLLVLVVPWVFVLVLVLLLLFYLLAKKPHPHGPRPPIPTAMLNRLLCL